MGDLNYQDDHWVMGEAVKLGLSEALIATMMPHLLDLCTAVMGLYYYIYKYIILIVVVIIWLMNIGDG